MSAENSARTVRQVDGLDSVRALQRVLYRSAKQDRTRRFHALFDKVARGDVTGSSIWFRVIRQEWTVATEDNGLERVPRNPPA